MWTSQFYVSEISEVIMKCVNHQRSCERYVNNVECNKALIFNLS